MEKLELKKLIKKVKPIFEKNPVIKLVYLFGSQANGNTGPMSDYDFAIYLDEKDKTKMFEIKLELIGKLSLILKTDNIDVVILNLTESPELKYDIIKQGILILEKKPYKVIEEPKILNRYFDFKQMMSKFDL
ncbi:nucleotidyltransferase domain-containing protein [Patescibacteria group bacterium]|nr:nucleotidyltransferase domain-containing protein [Patescibacteria group bacterium]